MNDKLSILVRVDLDCAQAQVAARGHVTLQSIQALFVVLKRANSLLEGLAMEVNVSQAKVDGAALEQLRASARSRHLPERIDPFQSDCRLSIVGPDAALHPAAPMRMAA